MSNPIITGLTAYVEEHNLPLISKAVLGAKSTKIFNLMSDVKGPSALNLLNTTVTFGDGSACGWNDEGTNELSQRILTPKALKVNMSICDKVLLKTWANYEVKVAAGMKNLPFEEDFIGGIIDGVNAKLEKMVYCGKAENGNEFDGILKILEDGGYDYSNRTKSAGTSVYETIKSAYMEIPASVLEKGDCAILVSADLFRKFIQELVTANLYHFNPNDAEGEYILPGTNVKVIAVNGLNDGYGNDIYDFVIAGSLSNLFYGTDMQGDENKVEVWYSQDNREFRVAIEFTAGVQVAYPDELSVWRLGR